MHVKRWIVDLGLQVVKVRLDHGSPIHSALLALSCAAASASSSVLSWRPISKKIPLSSRNARVVQLTLSASRSWARSRRGPSCPLTRPVTTTARIPDPCSASAGRNARNGTVNDTAVLKIASLSQERTSTLACPTTNPITMASATAYTNSKPIRHRWTVLVNAVTAEASSTSDDASLTSPSPSKIVSSRDGSPSRLPTDVAATASVGLMIAPSATPQPGPTRRAAS